MDEMRIKKDFPIFRTNPGLVYLDSGASAQKPQVVIDVEGKFYEESYANVHRGIYALSQKATNAYEMARETARKFINAATIKEIIFVRGTTEAINLVADSFGKTLKSGDIILLSEMEHHANIVPWQALTSPGATPPSQGGVRPTPSALRAARPVAGGAILRWIPVTDNGELDLTNIDELLKGVKLVAVTQMSNVLGTVNDVKMLAQKAHAVGAKILVDAAQSAPHMPIDVQDLDCDFLAFSGHKMCGPMGIGVLYGKQGILEMMEPYQRGGDMILEVTKETATWNDLPCKFEAGTPNAAGAVGLAAAMDYLSTIGMDNIWTHEQELTKYGLEQLSKIEGLKILGTLAPVAAGFKPAATMDRSRGAIFAFTMEGIHSHDIGSILDEQNIAVRAGHHCAQPLHKRFGLAATTRASCYLYNTKDDIDALVKGIAKIKETFA